MLKLWRMFRETVRGYDTSRQLAAGVAIGMVIGLVPKDSLFCYVLGLLMLISTANLLCGTISIFAFSWIGFLFDSVFHKVGAMVLTYQPLEATWGRLFQLPIVPWTRFDNTVVTGSLVVGLIATIPVYIISYKIVEAISPHLKIAADKSKIYRWIVGDNDSPKTELGT